MPRTRGTESEADADVDADGTDELPQGYQDDDERVHHSRFLRHTSILIWKCYLQRQRRWRYLLLETLLAATLLMAALYIAFPIFIIPLQVEPEPPLTAKQILASLPNDTLVGYAPPRSILRKIMKRTAELLNSDIIDGTSEADLHNKLLQLTKNSKSPVFERPVIWIIWSEYNSTINIWKFTIRSSERARYETRMNTAEYPNPHLRSGFLAVQLAISQAVVEHGSLRKPPKIKPTQVPWEYIDLKTVGDYQYKLYPVSSLLEPNSIEFKVQASSDAYVALITENYFNDTNKYNNIEIYISGWHNTKTRIHKHNLTTKAEAATPNFLSDKELRGFWVRWDEVCNIAVGREGQTDSFLSWRDPEPFPINYVGVATNWNISGNWKIKSNYY